MIHVDHGTENIQPMMNVFAGKGVKASWFLCGTWTASNSALVTKMASAGFELGNRAYTRGDLAKMKEADQRAELKNTHELVRKLTGVEMTLFSPTFGSYNKSTLKVARTLGYKTVLWTIDTSDWRDHDEDTVFNRATQNIRNGDIVIIHPTAHTLAALPKIIDYYLANGFNVVPVGQSIA
jgi:peptidoglycan/xylan/chitin deacetylase (PgdA/CDA1 family)